MTLTRREQVENDRSRFDFHDDIVYLAQTKRGLTRETVEEISAFKDEPEWMRNFRLRAYDHFLKRPMPTWGGDLSHIDFDKIMYYRKPSEREEKSWDDVPEQIKATFEKLGIPEAERKFLAGVGAQYDSEVVYHSVREELVKLGVVFMGTDQALKEYPEIFKKYFGTVVPPEDNKFSALNSAVWSGGSFVYVPKGVEVPLPLQAYFRINGENTGQFERTLIVVDEGAKVHYIEGCTAPLYATDSLHVAVVEVIALAGSKVRYTTIQNWSNDVYNLVTKRAHAHENANVEWIDANTGSRLTMKYPSIYLRGRGATADIISVAVAGKGQHQDTGAKAVHLAPDTRSRIVSKSVSKDGGRATYRGHLKVSPGSTGVVASVRCDALMLDDQSRSDTYPYIDIQEDDTTMTHEATVGKISQDQVFYLMSRGLTENEAQNLIVQGFLEVFTKELPMEYAIEFNRLVKLEMDGALGVSPADQLTGLDFITEATARERAAQVHEPDWLLADRLDAVRLFDTLPAEPNRLFTTYLDLRLVRFAELTPHAVVTDGGPTKGHAALPAGAGAFLHVREDAVVGRALSAEAAAAGVVVDTFANVLRDRPDLLREILQRQATLPNDDVFAQVARATYAVGALVHVPPGVRLSEPIVVRWSVGAAGRALVTRTVIHLGKGAQARLLEEQRSSVDGSGSAAAAGQSLWSGTSEVILDEGATLELAGEQDLGPDTVSFITRHAAIGEAATLHWALAHVGGLLVRSRVDNHLIGRAATVRQVEIGFGGGQQLFDLTSYTHHVGRDTTGDLLSKGIFQDRSRGFFKGLIDIQRTAVGTDSFLGEFAMLLDRKARSVAIPSLEIDQPDVRRASHSSSVGPVNENQLFYLETRGLPADLARKSIVLSFLEPVVARIPLPEAQDRLRALLDRKWDAGRTALAA